MGKVKRPVHFIERFPLKRAKAPPYAIGQISMSTQVWILSGIRTR